MRARVALVVFVALLANLTVLAGIRPAGVRPDALLLVAVVGGMVGGPERGAVIGFAAGLTTDLFLQAPFGLAALAFCLVGFGVGSVGTLIIRAAWWIPVVTALFASAAGVLLYVIAGMVVGQTHLVDGRVFVVAGLVGIMNAALSPVALRFARWALRSDVPDRSYAT